MSNVSLDYLSGSINPKNIIDTFKYRMKFSRDNLDYFHPEGLLVFCGSQGSGKTLSAVQYIKKLCIEYPRAILVTNTKISGLPAHTTVCDYRGIESLTKHSNSIYGVIFNRLIDGESSREEGGKLKFDTVKHFIWFHSPKLYNSYDTYAKMKRYSKEWKGVSSVDIYNRGVIDVKR